MTIHQILTHPMYKHIHESNLIEGFDDLEMDGASLEAWDFLGVTSELSTACVLHVHNLITQTQANFAEDHKGKFRSPGLPVNVRVGGRACPPFGEVPAMIKKWLKLYSDPVLKPYPPKTQHIDFEHIHPFVDGNGRVGRLLMWWAEDMMGLNYTPITYTGRWDYYGWFK